MIEQICAHIHNYFVHAYIQGDFSIENGTIEIPELMEGQYFCIRGSRMNDGVYVYPPTKLTDETFKGTIWDMRPPRDFLALVQSIDAWQAKYADVVDSPYQSESFGGYSYSKATGGKSGTTVTEAPTWQSTFRHLLNPWRKLC